MGADLKAIIFDFNGVIVDDEPLHLELFRRVLGEEGLTLTDEDYHEKYLGYDDRGAFIAALTDQGQAAKAEDDAYIGGLIERKAGYYLEAINGRMLLFPGVVELARRAAGRFPLAIASGALRHEIELVLIRAEIRDCFSVIVASEDVSACKPDPEGYVRALAALNEIRGGQGKIQPTECLVIEDSIAGIEAAHQAGMRCVAVANSYTAEELTAADAIVVSLTDFAPEAVFAELKKMYGELPAPR
ncbi:MAG TPA: HAD family phosphatase [Blastocatellia bacterium]|nr:HAD family phosphatase [Blastocatellia bacterium]